MLADSLPPNATKGPSETVSGWLDRVATDSHHRSHSERLGDQHFCPVDHIGGNLSRIYGTSVCDIFDMPALARIGHGMRQFSRSAGAQPTSPQP